MSSVLIVDDEETLAEVLGETFIAAGWSAERAGSAEEALEKFRLRPVDVLVVDKNLPGMSGLDLVREVRALSPAPAIVLITGYSSPESAELALNLDVDAYLEKPFESIFGMVDLATRLVARRRRMLESAPPNPDELFAVVAGPDAGTLSLLLGPGVPFETFASGESLRARSSTSRLPDVVVLQADGVADLTGVVQDVSARTPGATWIVLYDEPLPLPLLQELIELGVKALFDHDAYRRTVGELLERVRARKKSKRG